jgi:sulfite reductase alpha subunit-like flavoprotein
MSPALKANLEQWLEFFSDRTVTEKLAGDIIPLLEAEKSKGAAIGEVWRLNDLIMKPSMWMFGGDGWANDIGYGGIDHVLAGGHDVNICIFDTEVYSNTGGQSSKATPCGAVAKFAQGGRTQKKKDLGGLFMRYGTIYVASCAIGANYKQTVQTFSEAEAYNGPSIMVCYSPCIEHRTKTGLSQMSVDQREAVDCGYWPLYRFNPALKEKGLNPFCLDGKKLTGDVMKFLIKQNRYSQLARAAPELAEELHGKLQAHLKERHEMMRAEAAVQPKSASTNEADATGERVTILFGSDTGVTEQLAKKFSGMCSERGLRVSRVCDLDEMSEVDDLLTAGKDSLVLVMCATCGHGDFPQNASLFWSAISSPDIAAGTFKDMRFCVFGMGDRSYTDTFCEAAKLIDRRLEELGGERVLDMGIGDDRDEDKWETGFSKWLPEFWKVVKAAEPKDDGSPKAPLFSITIHEGAALAPKQICPPGATLLEVGENKQLTPKDYERDIRHFSLKMDGIDFPFDLGDAVAVYYENLKEDVDAALEWFGLEGDNVVTVTCVSDNVSDRHRSAFQERRSVRQILTEMLDLFGRPSKSFCANLARFATSSAERKTLQKMSTAAGAAEWKAVVDEACSYFDVCKKFPSAKPPLDQLLSIVPMTKPRLYSMASSPFYSPTVIDFTIVINAFKAAGTGAEKIGASTRYIQRVPVGKKVAAAAVCGTFKFPADDTTPMVMVGMGTGIAPIRAFLQDKLYKKQKGIKTGPMFVFYACRRNKELFYKEEWENYKAEGVLTELIDAYSHEGPKPFYASHKIDERPEVIAENLAAKGGYFYMCGPAVGIPPIVKAMKAAVAGQGKLGQAGAEKWFDDLQREGRYSEESY